MTLWKCEECKGIYSDKSEFDSCICSNPEPEIKVKRIKYTNEDGEEKTGYREERDEWNMIINRFGELLTTKDEATMIRSADSEENSEKISEEVE